MPNVFNSPGGAKNSIPIGVQKFISQNGHVRASFVEMSEIVDYACRIQHTSMSSSIALGRVMLGAVLMAAQLKNDQQIAIHFGCSGPFKTLYAQASYEGNIRAYVANPKAPDIVLHNQISLGPLVGDGNLTVSTYIPNSNQPQSSFIKIVSGEIGEDLVHYMNQSMQIPCILNLGVHLNSQGLIDICSGLLIELMPGHTPEEILKIENDFKKAPPLSKIIKPGISAQEVVDIFLKDFLMLQLSHPYGIQYQCTCTQSRVEESLKLLSENDWEEIFLENKEIDINCQMCGKKYVLSMQDLLRLHSNTGSKKIH